MELGLEASDKVVEAAREVLANTAPEELPAMRLPMEDEDLTIQEIRQSMAQEAFRRLIQEADQQMSGRVLPVEQKLLL
jgi:CRISPR/Cas system-associated protein Csm6